MYWQTVDFSVRDRLFLALFVFENDRAVLQLVAGGEFVLVNRGRVIRIAQPQPPAEHFIELPISRYLQAHGADPGRRELHHFALEAANLRIGPTFQERFFRVRIEQIGVPHVGPIRLFRVGIEQQRIDVRNRADGELLFGAVFGAILCPEDPRAHGALDHRVEGDLVSGLRVRFVLDVADHSRAFFGRLIGGAVSPGRDFDRALVLAHVAHGLRGVLPQLVVGNAGAVGGFAIAALFLGPGAIREDSHVLVGFVPDIFPFSEVVVELVSDLFEERLVIQRAHLGQIAAVVLSKVSILCSQPFSAARM
jgi:hypothetical protein